MTEFIEYKGERFYLQTTGRYFSSGRHGKHAKERLLHRRVWIDNFGPIPEGVEIHHLDENWRNNDPKNLELKSSVKHRSEHMQARMADPEFRARALQALTDSSTLAAEWHASPEGRAWHSQNAIQAWEKRKPISATCKVCAKTYEAYVASRSRFCSNACEQKEGYQRHKTAQGTCLQCGAAFTFNKYRKGGQECCSRTCGIRRRFGHPPTAPAEPQLW
jgi:hypothetical protein